MTISAVSNDAVYFAASRPRQRNDTYWSAASRRTSAYGEKTVKHGNVKELQVCGIHLVWRVEYNNPDLGSGELARYPDPVGSLSGAQSAQALVAACGRTLTPH